MPRMIAQVDGLETLCSETIIFSPGQTVEIHPFDDDPDYFFYFELELLKDTTEAGSWALSGDNLPVTVKVTRGWNWGQSSVSAQVPIALTNLHSFIATMQVALVGTPSLYFISLTYTIFKKPI